MKVVSFDVAKDLVKAGFPQNPLIQNKMIGDFVKEEYLTSNIINYSIEVDLNIPYCEYTETKNYIYKLPEDSIGKLRSEINISFLGDNKKYESIPAPTYIEVWIWLWKEKNIRIFLREFKESISLGCEIVYPDNSKQIVCCHKNNDIETAIAEAVELLVQQNKII